MQLYTKDTLKAPGNVLNHHPFLGGLISNVALALAHTGIGTSILIDYDICIVIVCS